MLDLIQANKRRTAALVAVCVAVIVVVGLVVGLLIGQVLVVTGLALIVAAAAVAWAYLRSDAIVLRFSRATPADPAVYKRLHNLVEGLCVANGLPKPAVFVIDDAAPNAFAVGRDPRHGSLAVTTGLLELLDRVELEGVLAHELSHIRSFDTLPATLTATLVAWPALLADGAQRRRQWNGGRAPREGDPTPTAAGAAPLASALGILSPLVAKGVHALVSDRREGLADIQACQMTRYPPGLIAAFEKLQRDVTVVHAASAATAHLWIAQPLSGVGDSGARGDLHAKFDTHPPLDERIALLREL